MLITRKFDKVWKIYHDDFMGMPVGPRNIHGLPFDYETLEWVSQEEAERERLRWESYLARQHEYETKRDAKKRRKKK